MKTLLLALLLVGCSAFDGRDDSLFLALGGSDGVSRISDEFLYALAANKSVLPLFAHTDIERFHRQFTTQLCAIAGGPCRYEGDSMRDTHRGMRITRAQFNSVVDDLIRAMERSDIATGAQNALLTRLAPLYDDIVEPGTAGRRMAEAARKPYPIVQ